jgi:hypothetical protein
MELIPTFLHALVWKSNSNICHLNPMFGRVFAFDSKGRDTAVTERLRPPAISSAILLLAE